MMTRSRGKHSNTQRGSTLVEFALVFPLLALTLFAIIQYGFIFAAFITVRNASAVGARQALISTTNAAAVAKAALGPMLNPNLPGAAATYGVTNVAGASAHRVTVTYPLPLIIPFVVPGSGSTRTLSATTVMR